MTSSKDSRLFILAVIPVLAAGLFFALQMDMDKNQAGVPVSPGIMTPEDQGSEPPSIVPGDRETTKIQYRNILLKGVSKDKAFGSEKVSGAVSA